MFYTGKENITEVLKYHVKRSREIIICSCYFDSRELLGLIQSAQSNLKLTVLSSCAYTNDYSKCSDILKRNKNSSFFTQKTSKPLNHIKSYSFKINGKWINLIGSMNMTAPGLNDNIELLVKVTNDKVPKVILDMTKGMKKLSKNDFIFLEEVRNILLALNVGIPKFKRGDILKESLPYRIFNFKKNDFKDGAYSSSKITNNRTSETTITGAYSFLSDENGNSLKGVLDKIKRNIEAMTYNIPSFGKLTTKCMIKEFESKLLRKSNKVNMNIIELIPIVKKW